MHSNLNSQHHDMIYIISKCLKIMFAFLEMTYQFVLVSQSPKQKKKKHNCLCYKKKNRYFSQTEQVSDIKI